MKGTIEKIRCTNTGEMDTWDVVDGGSTQGGLTWDFTVCLYLSATDRFGLSFACVFGLALALGEHICLVTSGGDLLVLYTGFIPLPALPLPPSPRAFARLRDVDED